MATDECKPRLLLRPDYLKIELRPLFDRSNEVRAITRLAAGLRRNTADMPHISRFQLCRDFTQGFNRPRHGLIGDPAAFVQAFTKPDDLRIGVDDLEAATARGRYQKPAIICPQIDGGKERRSIPS